MFKYDASPCLVEVYNKLLISGKVKSRSDFAKKCGLLPATLNEIVAKRQNMTVTQIYKICCTFPEIQPNDFFKLDYKEFHGNLIQGNNNHDNVQNDIKSFSEIIAAKEKQVDKLIELLTQMRNREK